MAASSLKLILCWHMHQPEYRDPDSGEFVLPWTYLHAIKDYTDMAAHVERNPDVRVVFNFTPVLLDQLEAYATQLAAGEPRDPLLQFLAAPSLADLDAAQRALILDSCFRSNHAKMIQPYPAYHRLQELYRQVAAQDAAGSAYLSGQYYADLLTWYHLAWTGETVRRSEPLVADLMAKGSGFDAADRQALLALIGRLIGELIPRYRALLDAGRIELSSTPAQHPIMPLLLDFATTHQSMPGAPLPASGHYPDGAARARAHLHAAVASHTARFGQPPTGMWPAEGAVSDGTLRLMAGAGVRWAATGEGVLANSLRSAGTATLPDRAQWLYQPYRVDTEDGSIQVFFRDDNLSDRIGFEYATWFARDAVNNFVQTLEQIQAQAADGSEPTVAVILDGENAWETYPYNGFYFLDDLYTTLAAHPSIRMTTFADVVARLPKPGPAVPHAGLPLTLRHVVAGSWVYGTFSTWIGSAEKNRGWDLLCAAKGCYDTLMQSGRLSDAQRQDAERRLAVCEASDWFWWFGDYNPQTSVASFDRLYRRNLQALYRALGLRVPVELDHPISTGGGEAEGGGTMRRAS